MFGNKKEPTAQERALELLEVELVRLHKLAEYQTSRDSALAEIAKLNQAIITIATGTIEARMKAIEDALSELYLLTERNVEKNDGQ